MPNHPVAESSSRRITQSPNHPIAESPNRRITQSARLSPVVRAEDTRCLPESLSYCSSPLILMIYHWIQSDQVCVAMCKRLVAAALY